MRRESANEKIAINAQNTYSVVGPEFADALKCKRKRRIELDGVMAPLTSQLLDTQMKVQSVVPVFYVANVDTASTYYVKVLGFALAFRYGTYAGLRLGQQEIHITDPAEPRQIIGAGSAYVICDKVDEYFEQIKTRGASTRSEPQDRTYGMHDFAVLDPDGNQITFGSIAESELTNGG